MRVKNRPEFGWQKQKDRVRLSDVSLAKEKTGR